MSDLTPTDPTPAGRKSDAGAVLGHRLPGPRLTARGVRWLLLVFAVPVLLLGVALDLLVQAVWGHCVGLWCGW